MKFPTRILLACWPKLRAKAENFLLKRRKLLFFICEISSGLRFWRSGNESTILGNPPCFRWRANPSTLFSFTNPSFVLKWNTVVTSLALAPKQTSNYFKTYASDILQKVLEGRRGLEKTRSTFFPHHLEVSSSAACSIRILLLYQIQSKSCYFSKYVI